MCPVRHGAYAQPTTMVTREANDTIKTWAFLGIGTPAVASCLNVYVFSRCCGRDPDAWQHYHASLVAETFSNSLFLSFLVVPWMLPTVQLPPSFGHV